MDELQNLSNANENVEKKPNQFWKIFGIVLLSVTLALLTVVVINVQ